MSLRCMLMMAVAAEFMFSHVLSFPSLMSPEEEIIGEVLTTKEKIGDVSVVAAEPIMEQITRMMESPYEREREKGEKALQELKAQTSDQGNEYVRMTMNGLNFFIYWGAKGTALREKNDDLLNQLWEAIKDFLYKIFNFFKNFFTSSNKDILNSVKNMGPLELDDLRFLLPALCDFRDMFKYIVDEQLKLMKDLNHKKHSISDQVKENMNKRIEDDKRYLEEIEKFIKEKEIEFNNKLKEKTGHIPQIEHEDTLQKESKDTSHKEK